MSVLTREFLESININMTDEMFDTFNAHFSESLYLQIVDNVLKQLTDSQMKEFMTLQYENNEIVWEWLNVKVPQLNDIIRDAVNALLSEIVQNSDQINEPTS